MVYTSEIEKLERRWAENPKGRNFAPLADAYRKAGELDRALELCKAGLDLHPDYVSAHIVHGRCLIDQKNDPGASDVFRKVLTLDPENVLALRILAEIAQRGGRFGEEVDWLGRLLAADPMNGDAAEALTRAKARAAVSSAPKAPEPVVRLVPDAAPRPRPDLLIEHHSEERTSTTLDARGTPKDLETFDGTMDLNAVGRDKARADGIEVQEEVELTPQDLVVEGLAHTQFETLFATPPEPTGSQDDLPTIDLPLIMPDEEPAAPAPAAGSVGATVPPPPPAAVSLSDDDGAADVAALSRAEPVLTETMADLYLRQGHEEDALRVYQALLAQRPGDPRLRARIDALRRGERPEGGRGGGGGTPAGETVPAFLKRILAGRPVPAAPYAPLAPPPATGPSLEDALRGALVGRGWGSGTHGEDESGEETVISAPGEATRPAADGISLDQVFGDEGPRSSLPPAGPASMDASSSQPTPRSSPPAAQQGGGFSFDQFFNAAESGPDSAGSAGAGSTDVPLPPPRTSGDASRPPVEDETDLDQFQAWLRGLKS